MRRMTISRSRIATLVAAALLTVATAARAQDTLQAKPDTLQIVTPDTMQMGAQQRPQTHVVQVGETLWGLAGTFFGDPLLWPEIYRLNTEVVEDPHWIYPGEELNFAGITPASTTPVAEAPAEPQPGDTTQVAVTPGDTSQAAMQAPRPVEAPPVETPSVEAPPAPPPPPPGDASAPTIFSRRRAAGYHIGSTGNDNFRYRPVRRGEFYSAGFLTEGESFPWGHVRGDANQPAEERSAETSSAPIYGTVELSAPGDATYNVGDSLLVASLTRDVPGWGTVVVPTGIVRVSHVQDHDILAEVVTQFGRVVDGQVTIPLEPFHDPGLVDPVPVENGLTATIIAPRDIHPVQGQQGIMFIDAGKEQGLVLGDLFEVWEPLSAARGETQQAVALLQIVHVRNRSASGFILQIYQSGIQSGQPVRLIRKMPS